MVEYFNLDMIVSIAYCVPSYRDVQFRMWAASTRLPTLPTQRTDSRNESVNSYVLFSVQWCFGKFGGRGQGGRGNRGEGMRERPDGDGPRGGRF